MKFIKWVAAQGGAEVIADRLGVSTQVVKLWLKGRSTPAAHNLIELVKMSNGAFGFADILKLRQFPTRK
jgi:hypothetical protein